MYLHQNVTSSKYSSPKISEVGVLLVACLSNYSTKMIIMRPMNVYKQGGTDSFQNDSTLKNGMNSS
jgi:hypothetical protein